MGYKQKLKHLVPSNYEDLQHTTQLCLQQIYGKPINGLLFRLRIAVYLLNAACRFNVVLRTKKLQFLPRYLVRVLFGLSYCVLYDLYPDIAIALNVIPKHHWLNQFCKAINTQILRKAKGIVVLTLAMKQQVLASCPEVIDKTFFIHTWAAYNLIMPIVKQTNWFVIQYNFVNKNTEVYSGDIGCCHATHTILNASNYLQKEPIQFVCLGGPKREELIEEVNQLGLQNFLTFCFFHINLIAKSDICSFISRLRLYLGNTLMYCCNLSCRHYALVI